MENNISNDQYLLVQKSVNKAIGSYINSRQQRIPEFVKTYFSFKGALKLHKKALSSDLYKGPLNIFWSLPNTGIKATSALLKKIGSKKIPYYLEKVPHGFETNVQKEVKWLIYTELLELPYFQKDRKSTKDALFAEILNQPDISDMFEEYFEEIKAKSKNPKFRAALEDNLMEYASSRTAAADLAGTIITLSVGASFFHKMTPGAMATGGTVAAAIAQQAAISNFVFGSTLGSLYYSIFPATASMGLIVASTGTIMAALSVVTSFAGIITDPVQVKLGIHQRRLKKFISYLESELKGKGNIDIDVVTETEEQPKGKLKRKNRIKKQKSGKYKIKDQYVVRVFDLLDMVKTAAGALK